MSTEQKITKFGQGQILFRQDDEGGTLYFIQKGIVELTFRDNETGEKSSIAQIGENSVLGTMSFLEEERRSATATALTDIECIIVNQSQRERLLSQVPKWFKVLVKDLSGNLRTLNKKYTALENKSRQLESQLKALQRRIDAKSNADAGSKAAEKTKTEDIPAPNSETESQLEPESVPEPKAPSDQDN